MSKTGEYTELRNLKALVKSSQGVLTDSALGLANSPLTVLECILLTPVIFAIKVSFGFCVMTLGARLGGACIPDTDRVHIKFVAT